MVASLTRCRWLSHIVNITTVTVPLLYIRHHVVAGHQFTSVLCHYRLRMAGANGNIRYMCELSVEIRYACQRWLALPRTHGVIGLLTRGLFSSYGGR